MIAISTITANLDGDVRLDYVGDTRENIARASRAATLDGSAIINHLGVSDGDRTIYIKSLEVGEEKESKLYGIFQNETYINIYLKDGSYKGIIKKIKPNNGIIDMTLWLESKEGA